MQFHVGKSVLKSHLQLPFTDEIQLAMQVASPKAMLFADGLCFESAIHFPKIFMPTEQRHSNLCRQNLSLMQLYFCRCIGKTTFSFSETISILSRHSREAKKSFQLILWKKYFNFGSLA